MARHLSAVLLFCLCSMAIHYLWTRRPEWSIDLERELKNLERYTRDYGFTEEQVFTARLAITQLCTGHGCSILPPYVNMPSDYIVVPEYKLSGCRITKAMSSVMTGAFCYLYDTDNFMSRNLSMTLNIGACNGRNEKESLDSSMSSSEGWTHLLLHRDPLERFMSNIADKCLYPLYLFSNCLGCFRDMSCILRAHHKRSLHYTPKMGDDFFHRHFAPQSWVCDQVRLGQNYTRVAYSAKDRSGTLNRFLGALDSAGVPHEKRAEIRSQLSGHSTVHTTTGSSQKKAYRRQLLGDAQMMRTLLQLYLYDYVIYGYEIPTI